MQLMSLLADWTEKGIREIKRQVNRHYIDNRIANKK